MISDNLLYLDNIDFTAEELLSIVYIYQLNHMKLGLPLNIVIQS